MNALAHVLAESAVDVEVLFALALVAAILVVVDIVMSHAATLLHAAVGVLALAAVLYWWP